MTQPGQEALLGRPTIHIVGANEESVGNTCCSILPDHSLCLLENADPSPLLGTFQASFKQAEGVSCPSCVPPKTSCDP